MESGQDLDWEAIRRRLQDAGGSAIWRSLEELADSEAFQRWARRELAPEVEQAGAGLSRRRFLQLAAASLGLAGLTACAGQAPRHVLPYVEQPPEALTPGEPLFFATAHVHDGYATGALAESHMGRPTKLEGNEAHPASLGASDIYMQASVLTLYDPQRAQAVSWPKAGYARRSWQEFEAALQRELQREAGQEGAGLRILTPAVSSPTLSAQLEAVEERFPQARWQQYEPLNWDNAYEGARLAFGEPYEARYDFLQADVIVSLDADFLGEFPGRLRYTRDFSRRRRVIAHEGAAAEATMNRLYTLSSAPTITSSMGDHGWAVRPAQIEAFARRLAQVVGVEGLETGGVAAGALEPELEQALPVVARELVDSRGRCLVLAGRNQPPAVHALAQSLNVSLDNVGRTVSYSEPLQADPGDQVARMEQLVQEMAGGDVKCLLILDGNPVYTAPADINFGAALESVPFSAHLSLYTDETSHHCDWHLPQAHYLETWGDARAYDGTATIMQPLIEPLYEGRSAHEVLAMVAQGEWREPYDIVRDYWQEQIGGEGAAFDRAWQMALREGLAPDSALPAVEVAVLPALALPEAEVDLGQELVALFRPDPAVWDGRYYNNVWLQELPKPFTKLTWDNAALLGPATAQRLGVDNEDVVRLRLQGREVNAPVFILPGVAEGCVTLPLGYGRGAVGDRDAGAGFDAYRLRSADGLWHAAGLALEATGETYTLARTQNHHAMEGRDLVRVATLAAYREDATLRGQAAEEGELPSFYPEYEYEGYAWGMSIDLNTCIGCNACVVACQAENNIPVVGKEEVRKGREMHWIRVDGYFAGDDLEAPRVYHQPVPCMHCEKAPCEPVCPTFATTHSSEGLNEMTYSRCIGTRYCSNNCPYKVRRFNFLDYVQEGEPVRDLLHNPEVTVRSRGVMEKCTYCVQRINRGRAAANAENRELEDGEVQTACQQACPANAIVFGDINDPDSAVAQAKAHPHDYGLLAGLGTQPRTTYLAKLLNLNDDLEDVAGGSG
ncbi:MAG TPA: TAT-variant-translocated molybdopterin oxidoreductase [Candidatus Sulfomarinibacteraceae bacterium]|nr:TAT-variant-translocated molybdopterin oxidoreductase [Candidatus Sulfomarinibacteraceae bacterium]